MWRESKPPTIATDEWSQAASLEALLAHELNALGVEPPLALAVSGGGDSAALLHLVAGWAGKGGHDPQTIFVLTVDHGLREGSLGEARTVAAWARAHGFHHETLEWRGAKPQSGIQEKARVARRELLCGWCRDHGVGDLLLAHTSGDQTETVGMRLLKGSGSAGLGGMERVAKGPFGVRICRPLLGVSREGLRAWLVAHGHGWIEDTSNEDLAFERVQMRKALAGTTAAEAHLDDLGAVALAAREALDAAADQFCRDALVLHEAAWAELDLVELRTAPRAVGEHVLSRLLVALGGGDHPPARKSLARLYEGLVSSRPRGGTLANCLVAPKREKEGQNSAIIGREARNISHLALTARQWALWDHRFEVKCAVPAVVKPLKDVGLEAFGAADRENIKAAVPPQLRDSLMVVAGEDGAYMVPHAGVGAADAVEVRFSRLRPFTSLSPGGIGKPV